jgi:2-polyprenyl-3-methyl-5-hydroxy-6-metoxy-1,4-benzoquinol methylase
MLISDEYRELNKELHETNEAYGTSGHKHAEAVVGLANAMQTADILDYGCGKGTLNSAIGIRLKEYDPAIPGKDDPPEPADIVVCGDVLEHIEPDCLDDVLDDLESLARRAVFLCVATRPAMKTLADGRNAHLIVEPKEWWLPKLMDRWDMMNFQDMGGEFIFVGMDK